MKSSKPKVAHQIFGKPLVRWVVDAAHAAGIDSVVGVVGHGREQVEPLLTDVTTVVQEEQLGTAHAVLAARGALEGRGGSLVVLTGDSPLVRAETIAELVRTREEANAAVVVLTMEAENPTGYGRIIRDAGGDVQEIVEQKDCTPEQAAVTECNSGFYCFDIETLFAALEEVSTDNAQGEYLSLIHISTSCLGSRSSESVMLENTCKRASSKLVSSMRGMAFLCCCGFV